MSALIASVAAGESTESGHYLLRVYKESVQRLSCELTSLSSFAAFVVVSMGSPAQRRCILWIGANCSPQDRTIAEKLSYSVAVEDLGAVVPDCVVEGRENPALLEPILSAMWVQGEDYKRSARSRATTAIINKTVYLYNMIKDPVKVPTTFQINQLACEAPEASTGKVGKLFFPATAERDGILVVNIGDQYDLWFSDAVGTIDQSLAKTALRSFAVDKAPEKRRGIESVMFSRNMRAITPLDRVVFRAHFTEESGKRIAFLSSSSSSSSLSSPGGGSRHRSSSDRRAGHDRSNIGSTANNAEGCSDCVGDTILRLLGMTGEGPSSRLFWGQGSSAGSGAGGFRSGDDFHGLSPEAEQAAIQQKISRLTQKIDIKFLNPPRWGSKLLVLDLDHTLIDFSCRFEFMFEQLKRPYLDKFLAACYRQQYDIAIWSQTNWRWLELKLTELNLLNRKEYKICFALDKSSMFTVRQNYIKPLQLIWNKFGDRWGPRNTVSFNGGRAFCSTPFSDLFPLPPPLPLHLPLPLPGTKTDTRGRPVAQF
jgi:HAD-superfamily hydrolase (TIGR02245 family)